MDDPNARASIGAFMPFGRRSEAGQHVTAALPCTAAVMRCNPDGSNLELVAWGLRNAYGMVWASFPMVDWSVHTIITTAVNPPIDIRFAPDGDLYILDFGRFEMSEQGVIAEAGSGVLWRWHPSICPP